MTSFHNQKAMLQKRHQSFNTPEEIIFKLIKTDTGYTPLSKTKLIKGYDSEVYSIDTKENHALIFKVKHFGNVSFKQEEWAIKECDKNGVPVPTILSIGKIQLGKEVKEYTIQNKIKGHSLADLRHSLTGQQIQKVLFNSGKILRKIHEFKASGFYHRQENGIWDFPSWEMYAQSFVNDRSKEKKQIMQAGFSENEFVEMVNYLEIYKNEFKYSKPTLCHGDYLPEHIFIDVNFNVTAVIDFGMFEENHPVHDFAFFAIEAPFIDLTPLISGYGEHEMFQDRFSQRLHLHMLELGMGHLSHSISEELKPESEFIAQRLKETFTKLTHEMPL